MNDMVLSGAEMDVVTNPLLQKEFVADKVLREQKLKARNK